MNSDRFFYHSFPRRKFGNEIGHGMAVLASVLDRGLLLTPERIELKEILESGAFSKPAWILQKRVCFTELSPVELANHAKQFGEFALEFEIATLRRMGAVPVFYVPFSGSECENTASAMLSRLGEIQEILDRVQKLKALMASSTNDSELLNMTKNGVVVASTRCTVGAAKDLIQLLEQEIQPIESLVGAVRALFGYFYPVENLAYTGELAYYRQREWRIVGNIVRNGVPVTKPVTEEDVRALVSLDPQYFNRELDFPDGIKTIASQCQFYSRRLDERPIHASVRRLIVPERAILQVGDLLSRKGAALEVVSLESLVKR